MKIKKIINGTILYKIAIIAYHYIMIPMVIEYVGL